MDKVRHIKLRRWSREISPIVHLALPIMSGMISQMLIGLADTMMLGRVGVVPLAASSFVNTLAHLPFLFSLGLLTSIAVVTAQTYGAEKAEELGEVLRHSLMLSLVVGVLTALVVAAFYPFRFWFGQPATLHIGDAWLKDLLSEYANSRQAPVTVNGDDVALILQSGGTVGIPRGIMLTHSALMAEAVQLHAWLKPVLSDWEDVILLNLPLFHVFGNAALMATAILGHYPMALVPDPRDHADMLNIIRNVRPAIFAGVPTLFSGLLKDPDVINKTVDLSSVKLAVSGAAPLSAEIKERFTRLTGIRLIQGYGLTETSAAIIAEPAVKPGKPGSIGIPLPDVNVKIVDTETGKRNLTTGQEGEIIVKCPQVMLGFRNSLEETAEMLRGGWLYTGDVGYLDKDGYIFITARKKELIKVSGFQVWPQEVVEVIKTHPAVADVCVRGIPDPLQGESVKAWVALKKGQQLTGDDLRTFCRQKLTAYKVPRYVEFRDELPRSLYGQQLCRKLVEEEKAKATAGV